MSNKKQLEISICCLFGFFCLAVLNIYLYRSTGVSAFKTKMLLNGIFLVLAALPTAYISQKEEVFQKSIGRIGAIVTALALIIEGINSFYISSHPFGGLLLWKNSPGFFLTVSFLMGLGGILYLVDSKTSKGIKISGAILFIAVIARGYVSFLIQSMASRVYDYDSFLDKIANLYFILGIIQIFVILITLVALILAIIRLCKPTGEDDPEEWKEDRTAIQETVSDKYQIYEESENEDTKIIDKFEYKVVEEKSESKFVATCISTYPSKAYIGSALLSLFGYFSLLAYFVYTTILYPLTRSYSGTFYSSHHSSSFPMVAVCLMGLATIVTFFVSLNNSMFRKSVGQLCGFFTSLTMGAWVYVFEMLFNKTRPDINGGLFIISIILLGIVAIVYFAFLNIYEVKGLKLFGFASLISYMAIFAVIFLINNSYESSYEYTKDLVEILKFCGIFFCATSMISFLFSIIALLKPTPKTPYEYRL